MECSIQLPWPARLKTPVERSSFVRVQQNERDFCNKILVHLPISLQSRRKYYRIKERKKEKIQNISNSTFSSIFIYIYIYIYNLLNL